MNVLCTLHTSSSSSNVGFGSMSSDFDVVNEEACDNVEFILREANEFIGDRSGVNAVRETSG